MAERQLHRYGETNPVEADVDSAVTIESGDLVYLETDAIEKAGEDTNSDGTGDLWSTSLAITQEAFHDLFLGVANATSNSGDVKDVRVSTGGVFEFDCASASFNVGDLVGPAKTAGNNLENQKVAAVATAALAVGYVVKRTASATKVLVRIVSTIVGGGPQVMA